jgi:UDP-MurNAc hydroxylase
MNSEAISQPLSVRPTIAWINHASYVFTYKDIRILCDPWLEGQVFNNGWSLLSKTVFKYDDFKDVTHVWCSHEHPDHFNVPTLKNINAEVRSQITFLYQSTSDKLVYDFCEKLNFRRIIELKNDQWFELDNEVNLLCGTHAGGDSWLYLRTPHVSVLNTNDCVIDKQKDAQNIKAKVGQVDVLLTQFSYGNWQGNRAEPHLRKAAVDQKLRQIDLQLRVFKPKYIIPFASFIWFSHSENCYMNDEINKIADIYKYLLNYGSAIPVVLYPGEKWEIAKEHDSLHSIAKYEPDYKKIYDNPLLTNAPRVNLERIGEAAEKFRKQVLEKLRKNVILCGLVFCKPLKIYVTDYDESFTFSLRKGLQRSNIQYEYNDIAMSSDSLIYGFRFPFGFNTLHVNGRFEIPKHGSLRNFMTYERFGYVINRGISIHNIITAVIRILLARLQKIRNLYRTLRIPEHA